jgi:hypothetical protein
MGFLDILIKNKRLFFLRLRKTALKYHKLFIILAILLICQNKYILQELTPMHLKINAGCWVS